MIYIIKVVIIMFMIHLLFYCHHKAQWATVLMSSVDLHVISVCLCLAVSLDFVLRNTCYLQSYSHDYLYSQYSGVEVGSGSLILMYIHSYLGKRLRAESNKHILLVCPGFNTRKKQYKYKYKWIIYLGKIWPEKRQNIYILKMIWKDLKRVII